MRLAAKSVQHDVEGACVCKIFLPIVDDPLGTELLAVVGLRRGGYDMRAKLTRDLDRMAADAAGAAVDQDAHSLLHLRDLDERDPGRQTRNAEARRLCGIDPDRYRRDRRLQEQ